MLLYEISNPFAIPSTWKRDSNLLWLLAANQKLTKDFCLSEKTRSSKDANHNLQDPARFGTFIFHLRREIYPSGTLSHQEWYSNIIMMVKQTHIHRFVCYIFPCHVWSIYVSLVILCSLYVSILCLVYVSFRCIVAMCGFTLYVPYMFPYLDCSICVSLTCMFAICFLTLYVRYMFSYLVCSLYVSLPCLFAICFLTVFLFPF